MLRKYSVGIGFIAVILMAAPLFANDNVDATWDDGSRVKRLAHQIENQARHVHQMAEQNAHHGDWWEERALRDLHVLENSATHFHAQVESWWSEPSHTRHDYERLVRDYRTARRSFRYLHAYRHIVGDFRELGYLIEELQSYYEGGHDPHDPHDPHHPY